MLIQALIRQTIEKKKALGYCRLVYVLRGMGSHLYLSRFTLQI